MDKGTDTKAVGTEVNAEISNINEPLQDEALLTPDEQLLKVVNPEGEFDIPIGEGNRKKVFWSRINFADRVYFRSYFRKKLKEAVNAGLISVETHYVGSPKNQPDGKLTVFELDPASVIESTLKVYFKKINGNRVLLSEGKDYTYAADFKALFFSKAPGDDIEWEYDYYDIRAYDELYQTTFSLVLIFLSCKDLDNHSKRIFKNIDDIKLNMLEINEIINIYTGTNPPEATLKN